MVEAEEELKQELMDAFNDLYSEIEIGLGVLQTNPTEDTLNNVFRAIHNIKGHASILALHHIIDFTHSLESVADAMRRNSLPLNFEVCECILLGLDRLRDLHKRDLWGQQFSDLNEKVIQGLFTQLANATPENTKERTNALLECLGNGHLFERADEETLRLLPDPTPPPPLPRATDRQLLDLAFFQELSFQVDSKNPFWIDRSIQLYDWSQKLNRAGGSPANSQQLAAATYMHDVGMSFLEPDLMQRSEKLTDAARAQLQRHVAWGYDLLIRMPTWEEAALIVLSHHERPDGLGYPNRLTGRLIHPGAKILAIIDAFFSMINGRADRTQRKSIVRAMAEINSLAGTQFDAEWVAIFNVMVKTEVQNGLI